MSLNIKSSLIFKILFLCFIWWEWLCYLRIFPKLCFAWTGNKWCKQFQQQRDREARLWRCPFLTFTSPFLRFISVILFFSLYSKFSNWWHLPIPESLPIFNSISKGAGTLKMKVNKLLLSIEILLGMWWFMKNMYDLYILCNGHSKVFVLKDLYQNISK